jgi:hypothetical protein
MRHAARVEREFQAVVPVLTWLWVSEFSGMFHIHPHGGRHLLEYLASSKLDLVIPRYVGGLGVLPLGCHGKPSGALPVDLQRLGLIFALGKTVILPPSRNP